MSTVLANERDNIRKLFPDTFKHARKSRLKGQIIFFLILTYLIVGFFTLDVVDIPKKWKPQNAAMFILDTYAHKDHVTMKWENPDNIKIAFEIDYPPEDITKFIRVFDEDTFGINYDTGNSANKGYDVDAEWAAYGDRILNVHIKDRSHNGSTTRLGTGDVDFQKFKSNLKKQRYNGMCILQTARSFVNKELDETLLNADFIRNLFNEQ